MAKSDLCLETSARLVQTRDITPPPPSTHMTHRPSQQSRWGKSCADSTTQGSRSQWLQLKGPQNMCNLAKWSPAASTWVWVWRGSLCCLVPVPKKARPSTSNDYRPVALMSHLMKSLERLVLSLLQPLVSSSLDPLQFAYQTKLGGHHLPAPPCLHPPRQTGKHRENHVPWLFQCV